MNDIQRNNIMFNDSLRLAAYHDNNIDNNNICSSAPLSVNIDDMPTLDVPCLEFHNLETLPVKMKLSNNGRTVTLIGSWPTVEQQPSITGANLVEKYYFSHLHFHWSVDCVGSEHFINGKGYALEMHVIFFKGSCKTLFEAQTQPNGLITLAYLFDITPHEHSGVNHITTRLINIRPCGKSAEIPVFTLSHLMDNQSEEYFTYPGKNNNLNGTFNITQWIVFTKPRFVSDEQIRQFFCIMNKRGHEIKRNCRTPKVAPVGYLFGPYLVTTKRSDNKVESLDMPLEQNEIHHDDRSDLKENTLIRDGSLITREELPSLINVASEQLNVILPKTPVTEVKNKISENESRILCVKPTRAQLLRYKFNKHKNVNLSAPKTFDLIIFNKNTNYDYQKPAWK